MEENGMGTICLFPAPMGFFPSPVQCIVTMLIKNGLDGKRKTWRIQGCHENSLIQIFEKSPHLMGLADYYSHISFMASLWSRFG